MKLRNTKKIKSDGIFFTDTLWFLPILCLLIIPTACLQKEEGCRDVSATNFAADAETDCEDCCNYPSITFEIDHVAGDTSLRYGDTVFFDNKEIKFLEASFYVNGITLTAPDQLLTISDQITLTDRDGNRNVTTDDIAIISRDISSFSYDLGSFRGQGNFETLNFQVGMTATQAATAPSSVPSAHPLSAQNGLFTGSDSTYVFARLRLVNLVLDDTLQYNMGTPVNFSLPFPVTINRGFDLDIPLEVDYLEWIRGINFADNNPINQAIIVGNLQNAFSIRQ